MRTTSITRMNPVRFSKKEFWLSVAIVLLTLGCQKEAQLPVVDFVFADGAKAPVDIQFENNTQFADSYIWDLGEGTFTKEKNPLATYNIPGKYEITLKAFNQEGSAQLTKTLSIHGITYRVANYSSWLIPDMYAIWDDPEYDVIQELGSIPSGKKSAYCYSEVLSIQIFCVWDEYTLLFFGEPFRLTNNQHNELEIYDYTQVYEVYYKSGDFSTAVKNLAEKKQSGIKSFSSWQATPQ
ncbi:MAG: PKD domain-containing protein [Salinivirgaceae bacterium]